MTSHTNGWSGNAGKIYGRPASKMYNYIKGKTDTLYAPISHDHTYIKDKDNYSFTSSTLPTSFDQGISCGFVQSDNAAFPSFGSVLTCRTYSGGGGTLQLYAPYSSTYGGTRLRARFGNYAVSNGNSWTAMKEIAWLEDIPTNTNQLTNGAGYITSSGSITGNAATATIATNANKLGNKDAGFIYKYGYAYPYGKSDKPWHKVASFTQDVKSAQINTGITFYVGEFYSSRTYGILNIQIRNEQAGVSPSFCHVVWSVNCGIACNEFVVGHSYSGTTVTYNLYVNRTGWSSYSLKKIAEQSWGSEQNTWSCFGANNGNEYCYATIPETSQYVSTNLTLSNPPASHTHTGYLSLDGGTMNNQNVVTNLNADLLDGYSGSSYSKKASAETFSGAKTFSTVINANSGIRIGSTDDIGWYPYNSRICAGLSAAQGVNVGTLLVSNAWADASKVPANGIYSKGKIKTPAGFFQDSDERLKDIISNIDVDIDKLSELRKVYFNFKDDADQKHIGVIAQDVQAIYPELVSENDEGTLSVDYTKLGVIALDAVDQLNQKNKKLEDRLNKLEELLKSKGII